MLEPVCQLLELSFTLLLQDGDAVLPNAYTGVVGFRIFK
jgi:hypothetical protein